MKLKIRDVSNLNETALLTPHCLYRLIVFTAAAYKTIHISYTQQLTGFIYFYDCSFELQYETSKVSLNIGFLCTQL